MTAVQSKLYSRKNGMIRISESEYFSNGKYNYMSTPLI